MALDADQIALVYEIYGIPKAGACIMLQHWLPFEGPSPDARAQVVFESAFLRTYIDAGIVALTEEQITRLEIAFTRWDVLTATDPKIFTAPFGTDSPEDICDFPKERESIRNLVMNAIGFWLPSGGWSAEANRRWQTS